MTDEEYLRAKLGAMLKRVPHGVNNGSYQMAVQYKAWVGQATKAHKDGRTKAQTLSSLINQYEAFK